MKRFKILFTILFLGFFNSQSQAHATAIDPVSTFKALTEGVNSALDYQIGDEWGKKPVTYEDVIADTFFARMAKATAMIRRGGTGFYLGVFNGHHIMATNHHVCPEAMDCSYDRAIEFPLLGFKTKIEEFYGSWPEIDLSLFSIEVNSLAFLQALSNNSSPFAFNEDVYRGEELTTIGFGVANNPLHKLMANQDSDCVVFSGNAEYRLMGDPDELNPGEYKAWSFANGCDVSHGDSGSAMMDRNNGHVVGIIWTGRIPKNKKVQSSQYLHEIMNQPNEDIWSELSYSVPAVHMKEYLQEQISSGAINTNFALTLSEMLK
jgi:hypothetical protein